ncbi:uncharacterized [Tachysurus ichikawai]
MKVQKPCFMTTSCSFHVTALMVQNYRVLRDAYSTELLHHTLALLHALHFLLIKNRAGHPAEESLGLDASGDENMKVLIKEEMIVEVVGESPAV